MISVEELFQKPGSSLYILSRVKGVGYAQLSGCGGHQLHETERSLNGNGAWAKAGFLPHHRPQEPGIQCLLACCILDQSLHVTCWQRRAIGLHLQREGCNKIILGGIQPGLLYQ